MTAPRRLTQVLLTQGARQDVVWIDTEFARVGKHVVDLDMCTAFAVTAIEDHVWVVSEVYGTREFADVDKQRAAWKRFADVLR